MDQQSVRVAHISDLHLTEGRRFDEHCASLIQTKVSLQRDNPSLIAVTGDLAGIFVPHRFTYQERNFLALYIRELSGIAPVVVIRGNHDPCGEIELFRSCSENFNVYCATEKPLYIKSIIEGCNITAVPWMPRGSIVHDAGSESDCVLNITALDRLSEHLTIKDNDSINILFAHYALVEAASTPFEITSTRDIILNEKYLNQFGYDYVGLGHIHTFYENGNISYPGTPVPISFAEHQPKGYSIVDIKKGQCNITRRDIKSWDMVDIKCNCVHGLACMSQPVSIKHGDRIKVIIDMANDTSNICDTSSISKYVEEKGGIIDQIKYTHVSAQPHSVKTTFAKPNELVAQKIRELDEAHYGRILDEFDAIRNLG